MNNSFEIEVNSISLDRLIELNFNFLIDGIYKALLGRPADPDGLNNYRELLNSSDGLFATISSIAESEEHRQYLIKKDSEIEVRPKGSSKEFINSLFLRLLGREATESEVDYCFYSERPLGFSVMEAVKKNGVMAKNVDGRSNSKFKISKVLLFGAYGNLNLGDSCQALVMRSILVNTLGLDGGDIFACSALGDDFIYPVEQKLGKKDIFNLSLVNDFDILFIGGGGLLSHPHQPLFDVNWVHSVSVPVVLFGIGADSRLIKTYSPLLDRAIFVSGRDEYSLNSLRILRPDAIFIADPVLCMPDSMGVDLMGKDGEVVDPDSLALKHDFVWILKHPSNAEDEIFLNIVSRYLSKVSCSHSVNRNIVVALEPDFDSVLEKWFPGRVNYVIQAKNLILMIKNARAVFTMRYHGAIFAALQGKPSFGFSQSKINALYSELGLPGRYYFDAQDLMDDILYGDIFVVKDDSVVRVEEIRCRLIDSMKKELRELFFDE